jgi:coproporphyrinogen III oxidase
MKKYEEKKESKIVISEVTCDDCGKDCTNTFFDVMLKASFSNDILFVKDICYDCYEKNYKELVMKHRDREAEEYEKAIRKIKER